MIDEVYLLAALRLGAGVDPAPLSVSAAARAAYALRLPGALTADLVPLPHPTGARNGAEPRLHRFAAPGVTIDVELTHADGRVDVAGQVTVSPGPVPADHAHAGHAHAGHDMPPDRPVDHAASDDALSLGRAPSNERPPAVGPAGAHPPSSHGTGSPSGDGLPLDRAPSAGHPSAMGPADAYTPSVHGAGSVVGGGRIVIRTPHDRWVRLPTETGYFAATGLPVGWLSIACHFPGRPTVATRWLHTGD